MTSSIFETMVVDLASLIGVESRYHAGPTDPWADHLLTEFVHFCLYGKNLRFIVPVSNSNIDPHKAEVPRIVQSLQAHSQFGISPVPYDKSTQLSFDDEWFDEHFNLWITCLDKPDTLCRIKAWSQLHASSWISSDHKTRVPEGTILDFNSLATENLRRASYVASRANIHLAHLYYVFDHAYRFPYYATIAGDTPYLCHPLRRTFVAPGMIHKQVASASFPALSFSGWVRKEAKSLDLDSLLRRLANMRQVVQGEGLAEMITADLDIDFVRSICVKMQIPPSFLPSFMKAVDRALNITAAGASGYIGYRLTHTAPGTALGIGVGAMIGPTLEAISSHWISRIPSQVVTNKSIRAAMYWPDFEAQVR